MKNYLTPILGLLLLCSSAIAQSAFPGDRGINLCKSTREDIWEREPIGFLDNFVRVERDEVVCFAVYTQQNGVLKMEDIAADLYDLCRDRHPGRRSDDEITLHKATGAALEDLAAALLAYQQAAN